MIQKREEMKDNRGFSLVELIIVIAIMAILVAVLAPQFLKYVERSRNSADVANAKEITNAISAWAADTKNTGSDQFSASKAAVIKVNGSGITFDTSVTKSVKTSAVVSNDADQAKVVKKALTEAGLLTGESDATSIKCRSSQNWKSYEIICEVDSSGTLYFTYGSFTDSFSGAHSGTDDFAASFQQKGNVSP